VIHHTDPWLTIHGGDCREVLRTLEADSVHMVCTSPPYWGLRDYGTPGQLGLEATPEEYVAAMVDVFREVRRVLRPDGTVWLNLGDSYAAGGGIGGNGYNDGRANRDLRGRSPVTAGLKPKDLVGIPWRVAFALQADGWYLRSDIIWSKPNPMPESVTDRPTKAHEYLFLLAKSARYFYDAAAVREAATFDGTRGNGNARETTPLNGDRWATHKGLTAYDGSGRNLRSVWTIATAPYPGAHFATFPPRLVEPCVKAGSPEGGVCPDCGAPWARVVERTAMVIARSERTHSMGQTRSSGTMLAPPTSETTGWRPTCDHGGDPVPATVLDPFAGTGTVGLVAQSLSRRALLVDLNPEYLVQCLGRNRQMPLGVAT